MKEYQYQLVQYIHDKVTGEFVNLGILLYEPSSKFIGCKFVHRLTRVSALFPDADCSLIAQNIRALKRSCNEIQEKDLSKVNSIEQLVSSSFMPIDDSAFTFSEIKRSLLPTNDDLKKALEKNFERLISKHIKESKQSTHTDQAVWKSFKQSFDKYEVSKHLSSHSIKTPVDEIKFDHAWKNGVWNCYQPLSLDTSKSKDKVYKWSGMINELERTDEGLHLFFLLSGSEKQEAVTQLAKEALESHKNKNLKVSIYTEQQSEELAMKVKEDMIRSNVICFGS